MNAIQVEHLTKRFGSLIAVEDLNLQIHAGEIFGFVGPNGAGKTSTIRILAGLLQPTAGEIFISGYSIQASPQEVRRRIGYMPDFFGVYPDLTVWEYLDFFAACYFIPEIRRQALIYELLNLVELQHRSNDQVDQLSRGMKQRLSLARALIHEPDVLLLDEPASGLDPRARIEIRELLVELASMGKTIFFSTHILSDVAEICTRVGIIEAGKLLTLGSLEELHLQVIPHRLIEVTVLDRLPQALELLERNPLVSEVKAVPAQELILRQRLEFEFIGGDSELSQLLHQLILLEIPVLHFSENTRNLEEVFLQATQGIVS